MRDELNLKGNTLQVFAVIYTFTNDGGTFTGSRDYIANTIGRSLREVARELKALTELGLIVKGCAKPPIKWSYTLPKKLIGAHLKEVSDVPRGHNTNNADTAQQLCPNGTSTVTNWHNNRADTAHNNKEKNKEYNKAEYKGREARESGAQKNKREYNRRGDNNRHNRYGEWSKEEERKKLKWFNNAFQAALARSYADTDDKITK